MYYTLTSNLLQICEGWAVIGNVEDEVTPLTKPLEIFIWEMDTNEFKDTLSDRYQGVDIVLLT